MIRAERSGSFQDRGPQVTTAGGTQVIGSADGHSTTIVERGQVTTIKTSDDGRAVISVNGVPVTDRQALTETIQRLAESGRLTGSHRAGLIRIDGRPLGEPELLAAGAAIGAAAMFVALTGLYVFSRIVRGLVRRRMKPAPVTVALPADLSPRIERIEQAVESITIEMERVAEGQRFSARLLSERLPMAAAPRLTPERVATPH